MAAAAPLVDPREANASTGAMQFGAINDSGNDKTTLRGTYPSSGDADGLLTVIASKPSGFMRVIVGDARNSASSVGVFAISDNGAGVHAVSNSNHGIYAQTNSGVGVSGVATTGRGGYFANDNGGQWAAEVRNAKATTRGARAKGLHVRGDLAVSNGIAGTAVTLSNGSDVYLHFVASPDPVFEDIGSARIDNGDGFIQIEQQFADAVKIDEGYAVFLTALGPNNGLYVAEKGPTGFRVREMGPPFTPRVEFHYRVVSQQAQLTGRRMRRFSTDQPPPPPPAGPSGTLTFPSNIAPAPPPRR
jgi:hypothetical protein